MNWEYQQINYSFNQIMIKINFKKVFAKSLIVLGIIGSTPVFIGAWWCLMMGIMLAWLGKVFLEEC